MQFLKINSSRGKPIKKKKKAGVVMLFKKIQLYRVRVCFFIDYYYYMIVSRANLGYALSVELTCLPPFYTLSQVIINKSPKYLSHTTWPQ